MNAAAWQLWIDTGGRVEDWYFEGGGEPPVKTWESGVASAVKRHGDHWIMEVRLPRNAMKGGTAPAAGRPWGANFCRSMRKPPRPGDQFSGWSPLLRGKFHQPDLFGHVDFTE